MQQTAFAQVTWMDPTVEQFINWLVNAVRKKNALDAYHHLRQ